MNKFSRNIILANTFDEFAKATETIDLSVEDLVCYDLSNIEVFYFLNLESVWYHLNWEWLTYDDYGYFKNSNADYSIIPKVPDGYRLKKIEYNMFENLAGNIELLNSNWSNLTYVDLRSTKNMTKFTADFTGAPITTAKYWICAKETYIKKFDLSGLDLESSQNIFIPFNRYTSERVFLVDDENKGFNLLFLPRMPYDYYNYIHWKGEGPFDPSCVFDLSKLPTWPTDRSINCFSYNNLYKFYDFGGTYRIPLVEENKVLGISYDALNLSPVTHIVFDCTYANENNVNSGNLYIDINNSTSIERLTAILNLEYIGKFYRKSYGFLNYYKNTKFNITSEDLDVISKVSESNLFNGCIFDFQSVSGTIDISELNNITHLFNGSLFVNLPLGETINYWSGEGSTAATGEYTIYTFPFKIKHKPILNSNFICDYLGCITEWYLGDVEFSDNESSESPFNNITLYILDDSIIKASSANYSVIIKDASKPHLFLKRRTLSSFTVYLNTENYPDLSDYPTYEIYTIEWDNELTDLLAIEESKFDNVGVFYARESSNKYLNMTILSKGCVINKGYKHSDTNIFYSYCACKVNEWGVVSNSSIYFVCTLKEGTHTNFYEAVMRGKDITPHSLEFNFKHQDYIQFTEELRNNMIAKGYDLVYRI